MLAQQEWLASMYYQDPAWADQYRPLIDEFGVDPVRRAWAEARARNIEARGDGSDFLASLRARLREIIAGLEPRDDIELLAAVDPDLLTTDPHLRQVFTQVLGSPVIRRSWTTWRRRQVEIEEVADTVVHWLGAVGLHEVVAAARSSGETGQAAEVLQHFWSRVSDRVLGAVLGPDYRRRQAEPLTGDVGGPEEPYKAEEARAELDLLENRARAVLSPRELEFFSAFAEAMLRVENDIEATREAEVALGLSTRSGPKYLRRIRQRLGSVRRVA